MDDHTQQNSTPVADVSQTQPVDLSQMPVMPSVDTNATQMPPVVADPTVPVVPADPMTASMPVMPADPMTQASQQVPDLPVVPGPSVMPVADTATTMPVAEPNLMPPAISAAPVTSAQMEQPMPVAPIMDAGTTAQAGPVTNEEIMEQLQRIEDRLDEMDEKL